jgi:hypothetical protein
MVASAASRLGQVCRIHAYQIQQKAAQTMEATVAERGQITLPKAVRDALGLTKGTQAQGRA